MIDTFYLICAYLRMIGKKMILIDCLILTACQLVEGYFTSLFVRIQIGWAALFELHISIHGLHCTKWVNDQQGSSLGSFPTFPSLSSPL